MKKIKNVVGYVTDLVGTDQKGLVIFVNNREIGTLRLPIDIEVEEA